MEKTVFKNKNELGVLKCSYFTFGDYTQNEKLSEPEHPRDTPQQCNNIFSMKFGSVWLVKMRYNYV